MVEVLVLYTETILLAMDQNQVYGHQGMMRGIVLLSLTTKDALTVMMWEVRYQPGIEYFGGDI